MAAPDVAVAPETIETIDPMTPMQLAESRSLTSRMLNKLQDMFGNNNKSKDKLAGHTESKHRAKQEKNKDNERAREKRTSHELVEQLAQAQAGSNTNLFKQRKNPLYRDDQPEAEISQNNRGLGRRDKNRVIVSKRKSAPLLEASPPLLEKKGSKQAVVRSSSQPVLASFTEEYVNRLKAVPFSLKEKMSNWCRRSPMALIKAHEPPLDHYNDFPSQPYEDKMCDEFGRNFNTLSREMGGRTTKPRVELVLQRYRPNRHGILCSFDRAPGAGNAAEDSNGPRKLSSSSVQPVLSMPPPSFNENVKQREGPVVHAAKHQPPKRAPTNVSLVPQASSINTEMIRGVLSGRPSMVSIDFDGSTDVRRTSLDMGKRGGLGSLANGMSTMSLVEPIAE